MKQFVASLPRAACSDARDLPMRGASGRQTNKQSKDNTDHAMRLCIEHVHAMKGTGLVAQIRCVALWTCAPLPTSLQSHVNKQLKLCLLVLEGFSTLLHAVHMTQASGPTASEVQYWR